MSYLFTYFAFLLVDSLYLCQFITCLFLNKVWGDLIVFHNLLRTSFHPEHCGAKNPWLIMAYIAATLNPEILKNFPGPIRVGKKKSGSGRVAGTRQGLKIMHINGRFGIWWCHPHHGVAVIITALVRFTSRACVLAVESPKGWKSLCQKEGIRMKGGQNYEDISTS